MVREQNANRFRPMCGHGAGLSIRPPVHDGARAGVAIRHRMALNHPPTPYVTIATPLEKRFAMRPIRLPALSRALALTALLPLGACATAPALDTAAGVPAFVPERFFAGRTIAQGEFVNTIDGSRRGLTATIDGKWNGRSLTLVENFLYSDGERDRKTWVLTKTGPTTYSGTREDVIGTADARLDGPLFRLAYRANVKTKQSSVELAFDDVLGLQPDGSVLNRATVSKLGIKVGEVTLKIRKPGRR